MERKTVADSVPAIRKSLDTPFYHKASPYNGVALTDIFPNTWKLPPFGSYGVFRKALGTAQDQVYLGEKTVDAALSDITKATQSDIDAKAK